MELKGSPGSASDTRYFSRARTLTYSESQLVRDREESVEFVVRTDIKKYDPKTKILEFDTTTVSKDGTVNLHDLAFPELKEKIDYVVEGTSGKILRAGDYSPQGLFFIPSIPMPSRQVEIGDTWTLEHLWFSASEALPLKLEMVAVLHDVVRCLKHDTCADLELSGGVELGDVNGENISNRFESRIWGRLLFDIDRGEVIWSDMRSREKMLGHKSRIEVTSCMVSETKLTAKYKTNAACQATESPVSSAPPM